METSELEVQEKVQQEHWWYVGRRQLLQDVMCDLLQKRDQMLFKSIYDIGCGVGGNYAPLHLFSQSVIGVDPNKAAAAFAKEKGYTKVIDAPLESILDVALAEVADVVVAMDVLEHVEDDIRGASLLKDMLVPGGLAIITVPAFSFLWGLQDDVSHHYRRYSLSEVCERLERVGLVVEHKTYFNTILFLPILLVRWAMRFVHSWKIQSENELNSPVINKILKKLFLIEVACLRRGWTFPFGVSAFVLAKKP